MILDFFKHVFCSLIFFHAANSYAISQLTYTFRPQLQSSEPFLHIELAFRTDHARETILQVPDYRLGEAQLGNQLRRVKLESGGKLYTERGRWVVSHQPYQEIRLSYDLVQDWHIKNYKQHRAYVQKNLIKFSAGVGLVMPYYTNPNVKIAYNFVGFPENWFTLSSFGSTRNQIYTGKLNAWKNFFIVVGNSAVIRLQKCELGADQKLFVVMDGTFDFTDAQFCDVLKNIISHQRAFFNDHHFPCYTVSLVSITNNNSDDSRWGGACFYNAIDMYSTSNAPLISIKKLCAHEHFHTWNGNRINWNSDECYHWFFEGFTDYYALVTGLRAGLFSLKEFLSFGNEFCSLYYTSPVINASNKRIGKEFWSTHEINRLPYYRGFVFALLLNYKIKAATQNKYSLDDLIKDIFARCYKAEEKFSVELLDKLARKYLSVSSTLR